MQQIDCITQLANSDNGQSVWIERLQSLFWVDHASLQLYQYHQPSQKISSNPLTAGILSLLPSLTHGFIATLEDGIGFYDLDQNKIHHISKPEPFASNKQSIAGITDSYQAYWLFTQRKNISGEEQVNLYQLDSALKMQKLEDENHHWDCTATPAFSKDGSILYQSSASTRYIYATHFDENRQAIETNSFCRISKQDGYPHGLCVDSEDALWVCHRTEGYLSRYSKDGECLDKIKIGAPGVKYCSFGGDKRDILFITTAGDEDLTRNRRKAPFGNAVLSFKPGVTGLAPHPFACRHPDSR